MTLFIYCLLSLLVIPQILFAQESSIYNHLAYVNMNKALNSVRDGKYARKRLERELREKEKSITKFQAELDAMKVSMSEKRHSLSSNNLHSMEKKYRSRFLELQQMISAYRQEIKMREKSLTQTIFNRLKKIIARIAADKKIDLVLDVSREVILFSAKGHDITDQVIKEYNRTY